MVRKHRLIPQLLLLDFQHLSSSLMVKKELISSLISRCICVTPVLNWSSPSLWVTTYLDPVVQITNLHQLIRLGGRGFQRGRHMYFLVFSHRPVQTEGRVINHKSEAAIGSQGKHLDKMMPVAFKHLVTDFKCPCVRLLWQVFYRRCVKDSLARKSRRLSWRPWGTCFLLPPKLLPKIWRSVCKRNASKDPFLSLNTY